MIAVVGERSSAHNRAARIVEGLKSTATLGLKSTATLKKLDY